MCSSPEAFDATAALVTSSVFDAWNPPILPEPQQEADAGMVLEDLPQEECLSYFAQLRQILIAGK